MIDKSYVIDKVAVKICLRGCNSAPPEKQTNLKTKCMILPNKIGDKRHYCQTSYSTVNNSVCSFSVCTAQNYPLYMALIIFITVSIKPLLWDSITPKNVPLCSTTNWIKSFQKVYEKKRWFTFVIIFSSSLFHFSFSWIFKLFLKGMDKVATRSIWSKTLLFLF